MVQIEFTFNGQYLLVLIQIAGKKGGEKEIDFGDSCSDT